MKILAVIAVAFLSWSALATAGAAPGDLLIKMKEGHAAFIPQLQGLGENGSGVESLGGNWIHVQVPQENLDAANTNTESLIETIKANPDVEYVQPNYPLGLIESYQAKDPEFRQLLEDLQNGRPVAELMPRGFFDDSSVFSHSFASGKPQLPGVSVAANHGPDPLTSRQWGMQAIHATDAWKVFSGSKKVIVAVIDTGVDYTHPDLVGNLWHNPKEIPNDGIDNDGNGFVDDVIGWDFYDNDNKPFDQAEGIIGTLLTDGNPGHGTHCAGNVGAVGNNSVGISGVSPNVSIMAVRFLNKKGQGDTAMAVKAINYAVQNGAKVLSNSWGSPGEDPKENNQALRDAIQNAENHGVLFVAAAGNGDSTGQGYDNDTSAKPSYPASYNYSNIVSVAAVDQKGNLASFSNYGEKTVHVAAPGVAIFSTMVGNRYNDVIFKLGRFEVPWDGTSMATPHVAGAAAMIWAAHPEYTVQEVKAKLMSTVTPLPSLKGKVASGGEINVAAAIK